MQACTNCRACAEVCPSGIGLRRLWLGLRYELADRAEVVYFAGCVAFFPLALAEILEAAGVDFTLLGEDEWCCGFPLLGAGMLEQAGELMDHNLAAVRAKGAASIPPSVIPGGATGRRSFSSWPTPQRCAS